MKKIFYLLFVFSLFSCGNEMQEFEVLESPVDQGELLSKDKDALAQNVALALANNIGNKSFKAFLKKEALKQKDGDNDILFVEALNANVNSSEASTRNVVEESSFRNLLQIGFDKMARTRANGSMTFEQTLRSIEKEYPLLQISIPDTECSSLDQMDFENNSPLVAYLPSEFDEKNPMNIIAYDENGNEHILNTAIEPNVPVVVIGENERLIAVPLLESLTRAITEKEYYRTAEHVYYLKHYELGECIGGSGSSGGSGTSLTNISSRDGNNLCDYISKAKFKDRKTLKKYEPWTKGRPEVRVDILNSALPVKAIRYETKGWWDGNTKTCNSQIINWDKDALGKYITYYWVEEDWGSTEDKTISVQMSLPNGVVTSVGVTIKAGSNDDEIGKTYVCYDDVIPSGGKEYDPTGSGYFSFWINLQ